MTFNEIIIRISNEDLTTNLIQDYKKGLLIITPDEFKRIKQGLSASLINPKYFNLINYVCLGLIYHPDDTLQEIKKRGILRYSNYNTRNIVVNLARQIKTIYKSLALKDEELIRYIDSIINFSFAFDSLKSLKKNLLFEYHKFKKKEVRKELDLQKHFLHL